MATSSDPGHFFQTSAALSEVERKATKSSNTNGNPIKLRSKILACIPDPARDQHVFAAESGGLVENVDIAAGEVVETFAGPQAPLTCLATSREELYAGCWDKNIYVWSISDAPTSQKTRKHDRVLQGGHTDFVKTLFRWREHNILVSGGADGTIVVWDVKSGRKLHTLKAHSRGVQALAHDWTATDGDSLMLYSADSNREIRRWRITATTARQIPILGAADNDDDDDVDAGATGQDAPEPLVAHETSVYALRFDAECEELWTASADRTAKCLDRRRGWAAATTLEHPDFVRDVAVDEARGWVATACRDEEVRVWDRASGRLHHVYSGHFDEVTALVLLPRAARLVSAGIDGTVRSWGLGRAELEAARREAEDERLGLEKEPAAPKTSLLTAEEEQELTELMDDDDDDD